MRAIEGVRDLRAGNWKYMEEEKMTNIQKTCN